MATQKLLFTRAHPPPAAPYLRLCSASFVRHNPPRSLICWTSRARREILAISSVGGEVSRHIHRGEISRISLSSPSEEYVVVSSNECATSIWRVKDRQLVLSDGRPGNIFSVVDGAFSENEQVYVTGTSHGTIRITTIREQLVNEC